MEINVGRTFDYPEFLWAVRGGEDALCLSQGGVLVRFSY